MAPSFPPRYLPTLTEVVVPAAAPQSLDPVTLAAEVVKNVMPQVERALRQQAHAHLDAQLDAALPSLQPLIEAAVRRALAKVDSQDKR